MSIRAPISKRRFGQAPLRPAIYISDAASIARDTRPSARAGEVAANRNEALMTQPRHERNAAFGAGAIVWSCMARVQKGVGEESFRQGTRFRLGRWPSELALLG